MNASISTHLLPALTGHHILVTRPVEQADHLCQLIEQQGGIAVKLPAIEIVDVEDKTPLLKVYQQLAHIQIAIFISVNAVNKALPTLLKLGQLPSRIVYIGVGKRTTAALQAFDIKAICPEPPFNSETILAIPMLQTPHIIDKQIMIFRGEGGRELLADALRQRGASVSYVCVYRRVQPPALPWMHPTKPDAIIVTSREGLQNLMAMLQRPAWLHDTSLILMSQRIIAEVQIQGLRSPTFIAPAASDEGLLAALLEWRKHSC